MTTIDTAAIAVELPQAFDGRWNRLPGIQVDGRRITIDPGEYFFRFESNTWLVADWELVKSQLLEAEETTESAVEQLALDFIKAHGESTSDAARVLSTAYEVYAYLFRDEHLAGLGLPQITAEHLRMLREAATLMALNNERKLLAVERAKLAEMKPFRKIAGPATRQAIRRTLRAALNSAIAQQLITFNPASHVELESGKRPKPLLWTDERVRRWRETGEAPGPVMVWTPQQFGTFLDAAEGDRLYAIFHLMGTRGLRRGEAVGQDWHEVDLGAGLITPAKEIVVDGWGPYESEPKTDGSANTIALDSMNITVLRDHKARQEKERAKWGTAWQDTGKAFTKEDGSWLHPETVSETFRRILATTDLPPITLRDLRHVAATLTHGGGGDIHTVKETLRHSTITLTSDTYTSLLPELDREIAEKAAKLIPRSRLAVAEPSASAPADPQDAGASAHAALTQEPENDAAPESTEADPSAA